MASWNTITIPFKSLTDRKGKYHQIDDAQSKTDAEANWTPGEPESPKPPVVLLSVSVIIFALSLLLHGLLRGYMPIDRPCTERMSAWAPMIEAVKYEWTQYDSQDLSPDFAGPPTYERESNWMAQYHHGFIPYPYSQIAQLNKSTSRDWWVHDGNLVTLTEWAHQIHCLGLIRQYIYRDQFDYADFTNTSSTRFHIHKDHCFMVLKTMIECKAEVTPVLFERDSSGLGAWRTRDAPRKCVRNELLVDFIEENKLCGLECVPEELEGL